MSNLVRRRGTLDIVDTAVGVGVAIIAALLLFKVVGWVFGAMVLLFKIAIVAIVIAVVVKAWTSLRGGDRY